MPGNARAMGTINMDIAKFMLFIAACACIRVWPDGVFFATKSSVEPLPATTERANLLHAPLSCSVTEL